MIDYYSDEEGALHVPVDGREVTNERNCAHLSEQGLHNLAYELLEEYGCL